MESSTVTMLNEEHVEIWEDIIINGLEEPHERDNEDMQPFFRLNSSFIAMSSPVMNDDINNSWVDKSGNVTIKAGDRKHVSLLSPIIMCTAGVLGNILALFVLSRTRKERRQTLFYTLVASLAIIDMMGQISTTPVVILTYLNNFRWPGGQPLCEYFSFVMIFAGLSTLEIVCAMSVERYVALKHPFFTQKYLTYEKAKYVIFVILGIAFILAIFPNIGVGANARQFPGTWCFIRFIDPENWVEQGYAYFYCCFGLSLISVTIVCNLSVAMTMLEMCRRRQERSLSLQSYDLEQGTKEKQKKQRCDHSELQMLILLAGITCIFTICWSPLMVRILMTLINPKPDDKTSILIVIRLASLNQIMDPWVYILFRKELFYRLKNAICHKSSPPCTKSSEMASSSSSRGIRILLKPTIKRLNSNLGGISNMKVDSDAGESERMIGNTDSVDSTPEKTIEDCKNSVSVADSEPADPKRLTRSESNSSSFIRIYKEDGEPQLVFTKVTKNEGQNVKDESFEKSAEKSCIS